MVLVQALAAGVHGVAASNRTAHASDGRSPVEQAGVAANSRIDLGAGRAGAIR